MKDPLLSEHERQESGAEKILAYFDNQLFVLDKENRDPGKDDIQTAITRGRIQEILLFQDKMNPKRKAAAAGRFDSMSGKPTQQEE